MSTVRPDPTRVDPDPPLEDSTQSGAALSQTRLNGDAYLPVDPLPDVARLKYKLRQRLQFTNELRYLLSRREFAASFDAHYETRWAEFWTKLLNELFGRELPSIVGKALRLWVPVWVAYTSGVITKKPELLLTLFAMYMVIGGVAWFAWRSRRRSARGQTVLNADLYGPTAVASDAAIVQARELIRAPDQTISAGYARVMADMNDANKSALAVLGVGRWRLDMWRWVDKG